mgnify:FL=1
MEQKMVKTIFIEMFLWRFGRGLKMQILVVTVSKIIFDYEDKTTSGFASYSKINEIIEQLANENNISERVISTIIFMFKYEPLIKEDYEEEIVEEYQDNQTNYNTSDYEVNTGR